MMRLCWGVVDGLTSSYRSVTNADRTRELLGWKPQRTEADWETVFLEDFKMIIEESKAQR